MTFPISSPSPQQVSHVPHKFPMRFSKSSQYLLSKVEQIETQVQFSIYGNSKTLFVGTNSVVLRPQNSVRLQERCFPSFAELCSSSGTLFRFVRETLFVLRNAVFLRSRNSVVLRNSRLSFVRWRIRRIHLQATRCLHCCGRRTQFRLRASVRVLQAQREGDNKRRPTEEITQKTNRQTQNIRAEELVADGGLWKRV
jgi:hypothetical protein